VAGGHEVTEEQANKFGKLLGDLISQRLRDRLAERREFTLRMSNIGKGARQLFYDKNYGSDEDFHASTLIKFMFGDIAEQLLLFLAELSGHEVTDQQAEVNLNGIKGHIDAIIDGVVVDVKSASSHSFRKFKDGTLLENDSFGYAEQLAGYCVALDKPGAWLAIDKQSGHLAYLPLDDIKSLDIPTRIEYVKQAVSSTVEPERCYDDEPEGASGNRALGINCSYCVAPTTKVLKSDLTWVPISSVNIGESIVGFKENDQLKLTHTNIEFKENLNLPSYQVNTDKGSITVSSDHMFMARIGDTGVFKWVKASDLTDNLTIKYFGAPWEQLNNNEASYISGFLDGEGCWSSNKLSWAQRPGPVADYVLEIMSKYGFDTPQRYVKKTSDCLMWRISKDAYSSFRAIGQFRPLRLLPKAILTIDNFRVKNSIKDHAKVLSVHYVGLTEVVSVKTSSSTLLTDGYYSHNCSHKFRCWSAANGGLGLRTFQYSNGPKFLTHVAREPKVRESTF
jgi:hypothetical protein